MSKPKVEGVIKLDAYGIVERAVEEGVKYGLTKAHKYSDGPPSDELLESQILGAVMLTLSEVLDWGNGRE